MNRYIVIFRLRQRCCGWLVEEDPRLASKAWSILLFMVLVAMGV